VNALEQRLEDVTEPIDVAVIGCCVNGPGEARAAQVGLAGASPSLLYIEGKADHKIPNEQLVDELERVIREQLRRRKDDPDLTKKVIPIQRKTG
jgi:(E)-4-hydroxy-3-methylbut-2-enyl-diphosphate synthase